MIGICTEVFASVANQSPAQDVAASLATDAQRKKWHLAVTHALRKTCRSALARENWHIQRHGRLTPRVRQQAGSYRCVLRLRVQISSSARFSIKYRAAVLLHRTQASSQCCSVECRPAVTAAVARSRPAVSAARPDWPSSRQGRRRPSFSLARAGRSISERLRPIRLSH